MAGLPSREEILTLLDRLGSEPADALESDELDFKRWRPLFASSRLASSLIWTSCYFSRT